MKRKIGIIIAGAIVASIAIAVGVVPSGDAYAETWCTAVTTHSGTTRGEAEYKRCAHIVLIDNYSSNVTTTVYGGGSSSQPISSTYLCGPDGGSASTSHSNGCFKAVFDRTTITSVSSDTETVVQNKKNTFVENVMSEIKQGKSHVDPCANAIGTPGESSCKYGSGNNNWMYYSTWEQYQAYLNANQNNTNPGGGGGGGGSEGDPTPGEGSSPSGEEKPADTGECTSILPGLFCNKDNPDNGEGILMLIRFIIGVMTGAVVVAGTVGIIICGVMMMTARDNEAQMTTAKRRLFEIVIGIVAWGLIAVLINFFIPQSEQATEDVFSVETSINGKKDA